MEAKYEFQHEGSPLGPRFLKKQCPYGTIPSPGTVIGSPLAYEHAPDQKRFAVLVCDIQSIQLLLLGVKHIRAYYKKTNNWQGEWLSP